MLVPFTFLALSTSVLAALNLDPLTNNIPTPIIPQLPSSLASALQIPSAVVTALPPPLETIANKTNVAIKTQNVTTALLTSNPGSGYLIDENALTGVLAPASCKADSVVGVQSTIQLAKLVNLCVCVQIIGFPIPNQKACPACPANAGPVCLTSSTDAGCSCACNDGFYAGSDGTCIPDSKCPPPNTITSNPDGTSTCTCDSPAYSPDGSGGCILTPSMAARRRRSRMLADMNANVVLGSRAYHSARCPYGESACRVGLGRGYECLDTRTSLDSCGGCLFEGGQNCLELPGVMGVGCVASECRISSCIPGWTFLAAEGICIRME